MKWQEWVLAVVVLALIMIGLRFLVQAAFLGYLS